MLIHSNITFRLIQNAFREQFYVNSFKYNVHIQSEMDVGLNFVLIQSNIMFKFNHKFVLYKFCDILFKYNVKFHSWCVSKQFVLIQSTIKFKLTLKFIYQRFYVKPFKYNVQTHLKCIFMTIIH
jgi:hypothetical protein